MIETLTETGAPGPDDVDPVSDVRVLALADSDSYLKWVCRTCDRLATDVPDLGVGVALVRSPLLPTAAQRQAATAGLDWLDDLPVLGPTTLAARIRRLRPDVVLVGATGPVAQLAVRTVLRLAQDGRGAGRRPAVISGLPGIALPATETAVRLRAGMDAFVVHSRAERHAYEALGRRTGRPIPTTLARLPFLPVDGLPRSVCRPVNRVVFAAQARIPETVGERTRILDALARLARARPDVRVVIKLRARAGERQTHDEAHPYDRLWQRYHRVAGFDPGLIDFGDGPMDEWLTPGAALVTVSSTAAVEALGQGLPTLVLGDFGVSDALLNAPFRGSGLLGDLADLAAGRFGVVRADWLRENWFHPEHSELGATVAWLAARSRAGTLDETSTLLAGSAGRTSSRTWVRSALPAPLTRMLWTVRRPR